MQKPAGWALQGTGGTDPEGSTGRSGMEVRLESDPSPHLGLVHYCASTLCWHFMGLSPINQEEGRYGKM